jgi:hypothetical protein
VLVRARKCAIVRKNSKVMNEVTSQSATVSGSSEIIQNWKCLGSNSLTFDCYSNLGYVSSSVAGRSQQDSRLPALMCELESRIFGLTNHKYSST